MGVLGPAGRLPVNHLGLDGGGAGIDPGGHGWGQERAYSNQVMVGLALVAAAELLSLNQPRSGGDFTR